MEKNKKPPTKAYAPFDNDISGFFFLYLCLRIFPGTNHILLSASSSLLSIDVLLYHFAILQRENVSQRYKNMI